MRTIKTTFFALFLVFSAGLFAQEEQPQEEPTKPHTNNNAFRQLYQEFSTPNQYRTGSGARAHRAAEGQGARGSHRAGAEDPGPHRPGADQPTDRRADVPRREDGEELRLVDAGEAGPDETHPGRDLRDQAPALLSE